MGCFIGEEMRLQEVSTSYEDVLYLALIKKLRKGWNKGSRRVKIIKKSQDILRNRRRI